MTLKNNKDLPYIFGSQFEFKVFYNNLKKDKFSFTPCKKFTLHKSNRWELETLKDKKIIKLPAENYVESLENF